MPLRFAHLAKASLRTSRGIAGQIGVSIAAALCVTAIGESVWRHDAPSERPVPAVTLDSAAVAGLLNATFTPDGIRARPRYPMEFEAVLGPTSTASFARYASAEWTAAGPQPAGGERGAAEAAVAAPVRARIAVSRIRAPASPIPPARVASLDVPAATRPAATRPAATAGAATPGAAASETRRATILGVSLPGFVPTGDDIVRTVASVAGSVAGSLPRI